ncbi:MAG: response regulator transcription factor [Phycicoccus sp.]
MRHGIAFGVTWGETELRPVAQIPIVVAAAFLVLLRRRTPAAVLVLGTAVLLGQKVAALPPSPVDLLPLVGVEAVAAYGSLPRRRWAVALTSVVAATAVVAVTRSSDRTAALIGLLRTSVLIALAVVIGVSRRNTVAAGRSGAEPPPPSTPTSADSRGARLTSPSSLTDPLTTREADVLRLLGRGLSNKEIAAELFVEPSTVKTHVSNVLRKLAVPDRTRAALVADQILATGRDRS